MTKMTSPEQPTWLPTMVALDWRVTPAQQQQAIRLPYLGGVFPTQQSTDLLKKERKRLDFKYKTRRQTQQ